MIYDGADIKLRVELHGVLSARFNFLRHAAVPLELLQILVGPDVPVGGEEFALLEEALPVRLAKEGARETDGEMGSVIVALQDLFMEVFHHSPHQLGPTVVKAVRRLDRVLGFQAVEVALVRLHIHYVELHLEILHDWRWVKGRVRDVRELLYLSDLTASSC